MQGKVAKALNITIVLPILNLMHYCTGSQWSCFRRWREEEPGGLLGTTVRLLRAHSAHVEDELSSCFVEAP